jgi:acetyl esterase/lipase
MEYTLHSDIVYKHADGVDIALDVYELPGGPPRPALLYFHGGALMTGTKDMPGTLLGLFSEWGYALVSANYRLAPEAKWPAYREDILDAHRWVRDNAARYTIEPDRVAAAGGSAGGYLALLLGAVARPRPRAVVSFWGYGDVAGDWYAKPDPFYLNLPLEDDCEVRRAVSDTVLTESPDPLRGAFYRYCRQHGLWPREVIGFQPAERLEVFDQACPERLITPDYPSTFLMHGTADTDVPFACAESMHAELEANGIENVFARIEGGPHGCLGKQADWAGADEPQVRAALEALRAFLAAHLG